MPSFVSPDSTEGLKEYDEHIKKRNRFYKDKKNVVSSNVMLIFICFPLVLYSYLNDQDL